MSDLVHAVGLHGAAFWVVKDRVGHIVRRGRARNKINNNALAAFAKWAIGVNNTGQGALPGPSQMQLGTGTGTPTPTDTGLFTPTAGTVQQITNPAVYQTFYAQYLAYWGSSTPAGNYSEAGLFDPAMTMWAHVLLQTSANQPYIPITAGQTLTILWKLRFVGN